MANQYLWTEQLGNYLTELISQELTETLGLARVVKLRPDELKDHPLAEELVNTLPAVYMILLGPEVRPGKVIGPVVDVDEQFRILFIRSTENEKGNSTSLNAAVEDLANLLMDHVNLGPDLFAQNTQLLKPMVIGAAEYDPPEVRPWKKLSPFLSGCAISVTITTTTITA